METALKAALTGTSRLYAALLAAGLMVAFIGGLALTGRTPGGQQLQRFEPDGIVAVSPPDIRAVELREGRNHFAFRRNESGSWVLDGPGALELPAELVAHLETALRFLHVSKPARTLEPEEYLETGLADFGLDPPISVVSLSAAGGLVATVDFGALNPAQTSQYVRLLGQRRVVLLPRHLGAEWRLAFDVASRTLPAETAAAHGRAAGYLLPTSMDAVWAVEILAGGKLSRFERDSAGSWFLHVGQHSHAAGATAHLADPAKARVIDAALAAFGETQVESVVAHRPSGGERERFGVEQPPLLAMVYARDNPTPLARVAIGNMAEDGFSRYAQLSNSGDVVTIAAYEAERLTDLLRKTGAAP